jgi:thioester reductase-like protein
MPKAVFLTGATGFLGGELLRRPLERSEVERVYVLCRARDAKDLRRRSHEVLFKLFPGKKKAEASAIASRTVWVRGDLSSTGLGLSAEDRQRVVGDVDWVIHSAASTQFDLPEEQARQINLDGAREVLRLAEEVNETGRLRRLLHISTAYVAGRRRGRILEEELPGHEGPFSNTYELTKAAAERMLRERMADVPITVVRPSIVVGSSATGRTYNFNVLYYPIKLIHRGLIPHTPGYATTTLDIVPVDYVCEGALALAELDEARGGTYHLTAGDDAIGLRRFCERITGFYNRQRERIDEPPLPVPRVVGPLRWRLLSWWVRRRLKGRALEQFEAFNLYIPYLLTEKCFDTTEARRLLEGRVPYPPIESYVDRVAEYAVTRSWGRRVSWDPALLESGVWSGSGARPLAEDAKEDASASHAEAATDGATARGG